MPDVEKMSEAEAKEALVNAGFLLENIMVNARPDSKIPVEKAIDTSKKKKILTKIQL